MESQTSIEPVNKVESKTRFFHFTPSLNLTVSGGRRNVFPFLDFSLFVFAQVLHHDISHVLAVFSLLVAYIKVCVHSLLHTQGTTRTNKITSEIMFLLSYCEDIFHPENTWCMVSCALIITLAQIFPRAM